MKTNRILLKCLGGAAVFVGLTACEAPLNLEGVEKEKQKTTHRFDQLQAIDSSGQMSVLVGAAGTVLITDNNGESWQRTDLPGGPSLVDVAACDDGHFIALATDRVLWVSDTSASNWQAKPIETMEEVLSIDCSGSDHYWVTGSFSTILDSRDNGVSWNENSLGEDAQLTTIQFLDEQNGFTTGEFGIVLKTEDSGANWNAMEYLPNEFYPQASYFKDESIGWVVGLSGSILHTADGGQSWQSQESGTDVPLYGVTGDKSSVISVGDNGLILSYQNGEWKPLDSSGQVLTYLRAITVDGNNVIAAGGNGSIITFKQ